MSSSQLKSVNRHIGSNAPASQKPLNPRLKLLHDLQEAVSLLKLSEGEDMSIHANEWITPTLRKLTELEHLKAVIAMAYGRSVEDIHELVIARDHTDKDYNTPRGRKGRPYDRDRVTKSIEDLKDAADSQDSRSMCEIFQHHYPSFLIAQKISEEDTLRLIEIAEELKKGAPDASHCSTVTDQVPSIPTPGESDRGDLSQESDFTPQENMANTGSEKDTLVTKTADHGFILPINNESPFKLSINMPGLDVKWEGSHKCAKAITTLIEKVVEGDAVKGKVVTDGRQDVKTYERTTFGPKANGLDAKDDILNGRILEELVVKSTQADGEHRTAADRVREQQERASKVISHFNHAIPTSLELFAQSNDEIVKCRLETKEKLEELKAATSQLKNANVELCGSLDVMKSSIKHHDDQIEESQRLIMDLSSTSTSISSSPTAIERRLHVLEDKVNNAPGHAVATKYATTAALDKLQDELDEHVTLTEDLFDRHDEELASVDYVDERLGEERAAVCKKFKKKMSKLETQLAAITSSVAELKAGAQPNSAEVARETDLATIVTDLAKQVEKLKLRLAHRTHDLDGISEVSTEEARKQDAADLQTEQKEDQNPEAPDAIKLAAATENNAADGGEVEDYGEIDDDDDDDDYEDTDADLEEYEEEVFDDEEELAPEHNNAEV